MPEQLFDLANEYEAMLNAGLSLSGETQEFFIEGRVRDILKRLPSKPRRILDFGCGNGKNSAYLAEVFRDAEIVGVDPAEAAILRAQQAFGSNRVKFGLLSELGSLGRFDLCYVNGVFHHIGPADRQEALQMIRSALAPGGYLALFENNPWNPGTLMVMRRIPFDRDAIPLSFLELKQRMKQAGYDIADTRFLFFLPRWLGALRFFERLLYWMPMGAQYWVLGKVR